MKEKIVQPKSAYPFLFLAILLLPANVLLFIFMQNAWPLLVTAAFLFVIRGLFVIDPNHATVLILFGKYVGTVKENGFFWTNPFYLRKGVSLRASNFDSERLKVNDKIGNPILISVILVWRVKNTYKAVFEVDKYKEFVRVQTDAAVRKLAGMYPYDNFDDQGVEVTLRSGLDVVNHDLEEEVKERMSIAGLEVLEARIGYLAYAPEIAGAMLKRQQATAIVAARFKIVEGAVSMVEDALQQMSEKDIMDLDEEKKAAMVSNLMVVLCSDREAAPVINTGSLYQ